MHHTQPLGELEELALRMEDIVYRAGLPRFDRVIHKTAYDELWFLWEEEKRLIIIELRDTSMDALRAAVEANVGRTADPVLN